MTADRRTASFCPSKETQAREEAKVQKLQMQGYPCIGNWSSFHEKLTLTVSDQANSKLERLVVSEDFYKRNRGKGIWVKVRFLL